MKKYIFLDFDGVVSILSSNYKLDKDKCKLIQDIIDETNAKIVVTSSWRQNTLKATLKDLKTIGWRVPFVPSWVDDIVGITVRSYHWCNINKEMSNTMIIPRGVEIDEWLRRNLDNDYYDKTKYNYVILDDDTDMLYNQRDNFIKTDTYNGISKRDTIKAIEILNREC